MEMLVDFSLPSGLPAAQAATRPGTADAPRHATALSVAIVDDDPFYRDHLSWLLSREPGIEVVGTYEDARSAVAGITSNPPDVVLMDIGMPGTDGIACVRMLKHQIPDLHVVMQTVYADDDRVFDSLRAGAEGYILKKAPFPKVVEALRDAASGGAPLSGEVAKKVLQFFRNPAGRGTDHGLSARESEVLDLLVEGHSYKEIADRLFVSAHTVRFHTHNIYEKLHVRSRAEAVAKVRSYRN